MVLEATGNTAAIVNVRRRHVARVAIANPLQVRLITEARVKTDKIDAAVLAQLYASGFLPEFSNEDRDGNWAGLTRRKSQLPTGNISGSESGQDSSDSTAAIGFIYNLTIVSVCNT